MQILWSCHWNAWNPDQFLVSPGPTLRRNSNRHTHQQKEMTEKDIPPSPFMEILVITETEARASYSKETEMQDCIYKGVSFNCHYGWSNYSNDSFMAGRRVPLVEAKPLYGLLDLLVKSWVSVDFCKVNVELLLDGDIGYFKHPCCWIVILLYPRHSRNCLQFKVMNEYWERSTRL